MRVQNIINDRSIRCITYGSSNQREEEHITKREETRHTIDSSTHHLAAFAACAPASYVPSGDNARAAVGQVEEKRGGEEDNVLGREWRVGY